MIHKILTAYASRLEEYLSRSYRRPEGIARVGMIGESGESCPNQLLVSLINLEKEASGDGGHMQWNAPGHIRKRAPLQLNMYVMLAAVYESKRYTEALSVLSNTLAFIQDLPKFEVEADCYTIEFVPTSMADLHNIWTTMGGHYHPSVICKIRGLVMKSDRVMSSSSVAGTTDVSL